MKKTIIILIIAGLVIMFMGVVGFSYYQKSQVEWRKQEQSSNVGPIIIGGILPLTGDSAPVGVPIKRAAELALSEVNGRGGVNGRLINLEIRDGKCDARTAAEEATNLINEFNIPVIFGGACSSETLAIAPIAERAGIILFSPASTSPDITTAGDYIFRNAPSDASQGRLLAEVAIKKGYKKVGAIVENTDYAVGIEQIFKSVFSEQNRSVVSNDYSSDAISVEDELRSIKESNVDALLILVQSPGKAGLIFAELEKMNWSVPLLSNDVVLGAKEELNAHRAFTNGIIGADLDINESNVSFQDFVQKYESVYGESVTYSLYASLGYDAMNIIIEALTKTNGSVEAIRLYLNSITNRIGAAGALTLDKNGDPVSGHVLKQFIDGVIKPYSL